MTKKYKPMTNFCSLNKGETFPKKTKVIKDINKILFWKTLHVDMTCPKDKWQNLKSKEKYSKLKGPKKKAIIVAWITKMTLFKKRVHQFISVELLIQSLWEATWKQRMSQTLSKFRIRRVWREQEKLMN